VVRSVATDVEVLDPAVALRIGPQPQHLRRPGCAWWPFGGVDEPAGRRW